MVALVIAAILAFAATNIDDLLVLLVLFGQRRHVATVVLGQYLGFAAIMVVSLLVSVGAMLVRPEWIGFAGLAPLAIGIKDLVAMRGRGLGMASTPTVGVSGVLSTAAITFANGGDNIAAYGPLLARRPFHEVALILGVFGILVALWCSVAYRLVQLPIFASTLDVRYCARRRVTEQLVQLPIFASTLDRWGHRLAPFVLIGLGVYIFVDAGTAAVISAWVHRLGAQTLATDAGTLSESIRAP
jgi:cadmium resistance protein CadD (predicted permease)